MNDIDFRNTLVKALELDRTPISENQGFVYTFEKQHLH